MTIRPLRRVSKETRERARQLRKDATGPEQVLWSVLCHKQLNGLKFRRQHPIEPYIVDFYCSEAKLVVELDGESHDERQAYDQKRTEFLNGLGLREMRVTNDEVLGNLEGVAEAILREARQAGVKWKKPSLLRREGLGEGCPRPDVI
jgi:very-short-patch-repair endonuclease